MENEVTNIESKPKEYGGIISTIVIIILLIAGGWYFIGNRIGKINEVSIGINTGTSTEIEDIQKDLDDLNLDILN